MKLTQTEFIKRYCHNSKTSEKRLNELGLFAILCECEYKECTGWVMITKEQLKTHIDLYLKN